VEWRDAADGVAAGAAADGRVALAWKSWNSAQLISRSPLRSIAWKRCSSTSRDPSSWRICWGIPRNSETCELDLQALMSSLLLTLPSWLGSHMSKIRRSSTSCDSGTPELATDSMACVAPRDWALCRLGASSNVPGKATLACDSMSTVRERALSSGATVGWKASLA